MASINNVNLQIISEEQGIAKVRVTYELVGDEADKEERPIYLEYVDLVGDDEEPGEDGHSEFLTNGELFTGLMRFGPTEPKFVRHRTFDVSSTLLDEDRGVGPFSAFPVEDEIRARVKLTPLMFSTVARSNLVRRGGLIKKATPLPA